LASGYGYRRTRCDHRISGAPGTDELSRAFYVRPDDAFLQSLSRNAPIVEVGQGAAASVQLTITHWPD